jgi:hypothetical protein
MKISELIEYLELNDASQEAQDEAANYLRELSTALRILTRQYIEIVNGEWGKGKGNQWLPDEVKEVLPKIGKIENV